MDGEKVERANQLMGDRSLRLRSDGDDAPPWASCFSEEERGDADMLSRLGMLFFIVLPVVVFALGVAVAVILALGWAIQHVIA
jgi:hypothetical protein